MNQSTLRFRFQFFPLLLIVCFSGLAQQKPSSPPKSELALKVDRGDGIPLDINAFPGSSASISSSKPIKSEKPATLESPVDSMTLKIDREADTVIVHLSVRLASEKQLPVSTYRLRENETVKTEELSKFDLEPLVLSVVKAKPDLQAPSPPLHPLLENKTGAIEVIGFYPEESEDFLLTIRNVSSKAIIGLDLFIPSADGNGGDGLRAQGSKQHPVILPGATISQPISLSRGGRMTPNGYLPNPEVQRTLIIRTVVFADGTYDGLVEPAAEIEAHRRGSQIQRTRILRLLQEGTDAERGNLINSIDDLKERAFALENKVDPSIGRELQSLFPSLKDRKGDWPVETVRAALREVKLGLLREIEDFENVQKQPGTHPTLAVWLEQRKANYKKLIAEFN